MPEREGVDTSGWGRHEKLAAVLASGRPVYESAWSNAGHDLILTPEAREAGYREA